VNEVLTSVEGVVDETERTHHQVLGEGIARIRYLDEQPASRTKQGATTAQNSTRRADVLEHVDKRYNVEICRR